MGHNVMFYETLLELMSIFILYYIYIYIYIMIHKHNKNTYSINKKII